MADTFGDRLRAQMAGDSGNKMKVALEAVSEWIEAEVLANLEKTMEAAATAGKDRHTFVHVYKGGAHPQSHEIEELLSYVLLKGTADKLGLDILPMSHRLFGPRDPRDYPCLEIVVKIPPSWKADYPNLKISAW